MNILMNKDVDFVGGGGGVDYFGGFSSPYPPPPPRFSGSIHTIYWDAYFLDRQTLTSQLSSVLTCKALAMLKTA